MSVCFGRQPSGCMFVRPPESSPGGGPPPMFLLFTMNT
ncbi:hypothetical protein L195_g013214 [Trifolium pratense]|uniref:Uncharacterized protein n=1 Tax=Trifolium pratense TaxID=57577 RepID=A0A2K3PMH8_TRIPR|nr:hypothetical protein L195_g013214 [Trifolium pratense]